MIPQEYSNLTVRSIDLVVEDLEGPARERTIDRLIAEITVEPFEATVAYRKGRRWVQGTNRCAWSAGRRIRSG